MLRYVMGSIGPMMGEYLMGAVITHRSQHSLLNFSAWPLLSKQQEYFWLPHQQDDFSTVFQSWVGLDTILYALKILVVLQVLRALPPFHQENVIV